MNNGAQRYESTRTPERNLRDTGTSLVVWSTCSIGLILVYALSWWRAGFTGILSVFSHGTLVAVAFGSLGSLVGFLFGIPRTLQNLAPASKPPSPAADGNTVQDAHDDNGYHQIVNTNLEQISDWLTKILVGVGLTQLDKIPHKLMGLAEYFGPGVGGNAPVTLAILLNSMVFGFFAGYLLTRLFLASAFAGADPDNSISKAAQKAEVLTEAGAYNKAAATLETTVPDVGPNTPKAVKKSVYEQLVYNNLYVDPPDGFQKAIEYGSAYVNEEPQDPSAKIWAYLAAAYGQKFKWEQKHENRPAVLESARKSALDAIAHSLTLTPQMKSLLRSIWDPTDTIKQQSGEDDLEVFYGDPEFQKILS